MDHGKLPIRVCELSLRIDAHGREEADMRPRKAVLVCGDDSDAVGEMAYMLNLQHFSARKCTNNGLAQALKERFLYCVVLLQRPQEDLKGIASIVAERERIPVLRVTAGCSNVIVLEDVKMLCAAKRGPKPAERPVGRQRMTGE